MIGKTAVVIGQGSGLYFNHLLKQLGASKLVGRDHKPNRVDLSQYYGATNSILNIDGNAAGAKADITTTLWPT